MGLMTECYIDRMDAEMDNDNANTVVALKKFKNKVDEMSLKDTTFLISNWLAYSMCIHKEDDKHKVKQQLDLLKQHIQAFTI